MKSYFKSALLGILCVCMLAACGKTGKQNETPVVIWCEAACEEAANGIVQYLNKTQPGGYAAEVVALPEDTSQTQEDDYKRLRTELLAGNGPDLFLLQGYDTTYARAFLFKDVEKSARAGMFLDVASYFEGDAPLAAQSFVAPVMEAGVIDGKRYMVPLLYTCEFNYGKEKAFAGVDIASMQSYTGYLQELQKQPQLWDATGDIPCYTWFDKNIFNYSAGELLLDKALFKQGCDATLARHIAAEALGDASQYLSRGPAKVPQSEVILPAPNGGGSITPRVSAYAAVYGKSKNVDASMLFIQTLLSDTLQNGKELRADEKTYVNAFDNASLQSTVFGGAGYPVTGGAYGDERLQKLEARLCKAVFLCEGHTMLEEAIRDMWFTAFTQTNKSYDFEAFYATLSSALEKYVAE